MADDLGTAVLRVVVDDEEARRSLSALRQEVDRASQDITRRTRRATSQAAGGGDGGDLPLTIDRQSVRRFNLRGLNAALESIAEDIDSIRTARGVNIGASWTKALEVLSEIEGDLRRLDAGTKLNLGSSWTAALQSLQEIDEDLRKIQAGEKLNLNTSWTAALQTLQEVDEDLRKLQAGRQLNLNTSWTAALQSLQEIDEDLRRLAGAQRLNLNTNWTAALALLSEVDEDLRLIRAGERLNLNNSWTSALDQLTEIDSDLRFIGASRDLNIRSSWVKALQQLEDIRDDITRAAAEEGRRVGRLNVSPIRGGAAFPGSPDFIRARQRELGELFAQREQRLRSLDLSTLRAQDRRSGLRQLPAGRGRGFDIGGTISSTVIGGAFPLLFGQGTGAAAGGLFGGLVGGIGGPGGGFAGSLVGTAVGQIADQFRQLTVALDDPIKALDLLKERAALSGRGIELLAEQLIATGRSAEASSLIQSNLGRVLDPSVIRSVAAANEAYSRNIGELQLKLGAFLSGPATGFSEWLTDVINRASNLPSGAPTQPGALATRGQGAALGIGGTLLAALGVGLSFTGVGASIGIPIALAGAGLAGVGAVQIAGAASQEQQIAAAKTTEQNQQRILKIDEARIGYQRQLNAASRTGQFNTQRELQLKDQLAAVEQERQKAIAAFASTPGDTRPGEVQAYRAQIEALKLRREELQRNFDLQTKLIEADARITQLQAGGLERDALVEQLRRVDISGGDPVASLTKQQSLLAQIAALDRERAATLRLISSETEIQAGAIERKLQNAQALAQVEAGILRDALAQRQAIEESTASAVERERALRAELGEAQVLGDETAIFRATTQLYLAAGQTKLALIDGARALSDAGRSLKDNILNAQRSIRSTLEGSFDLLRAPIQQQLLEQARGRINFSLFDVGRVRTPSEIFGAAAASESIAAQQAVIAQSSTALVDVNSQLAKVTKELADKKWDVAVNVLGASGAQIIGDVVGATA